MYPVGSEVILSDGQRGFVVAKSPDWGRPVVRITRDKRGEKLPKREQYTVNLVEEPLLSISEFKMVNVGTQEGDLQPEKQPS